jgi:3-methyladenine DNA glycosylase/8-oxoguanine DNA glycosylase
MPTTRLIQATEALARLDPIMASLIDREGPCTLRGRRTTKGAFEALARAIVFQQLAGKAANTIFDRFRTAVGGGVTADAIVSTPVEALRAAGLSGAKTASVLDLAARVASGELDLTRLRRLDDEAVIEQLVNVRGIGRWTAEMFLIFELQRLDVWPVDDLGVRKGYALAFGMPSVPTAKELVGLGTRFAPYRSIAAWYCWRAADAG